MNEHRTVTAPDLLAAFKEPARLTYRQHTVLGDSGSMDGSLVTDGGLSLPLDFCPPAEGQTCDDNELHVTANGDLIGIIHKAANARTFWMMGVSMWAKEYLGRNDINFG